MTWLDHELIGTDPAYSRPGLIVLAITCTSVLCQWLLSRFVLRGDRLTWLVVPYDLIAWSATALVTLSVLIALIYAVGNGGPILSIAIAVCPTLLGSLLRGHIGVTTDLSIALGTATLAGWIACWKAFHRSNPSLSRGVGLGTTTATTVVAIGTARTIADTVGPHAQHELILATGLLTMGLLFAGYWTLRLAFHSNQQST